MGHQVTIDSHSGFCGGVIRAIRRAESLLDQGRKLYSLGAIVHNDEELHRLHSKGLHTITLEEAPSLPPGSAVLIRAHGEPPATYRRIRQLPLELVECTCPVVLHLQQMIKQEYARIKPLGGRILLFGKPNHAEVNGLLGQVNGDALVIERLADVDRLSGLLGCEGGAAAGADAAAADADADAGVAAGLAGAPPVSIFSQTTKDPVEYAAVCERLRQLRVNLTVYDTICQQVAHRLPQLMQFAANHNIILFVSGKDSSNGKVLRSICKQTNPRTYAVENQNDICPAWFREGDTVGVCGATSTPKWVMEAVAQCVKDLP